MYSQWAFERFGKQMAKKFPRDIKPKQKKDK